MSNTTPHHEKDLALATACLEGDEAAWEQFVDRYRPALYAAARALTGDAASGIELADSVWAELYGVGRTKASLEPGTPARPLLRYYHGRASLATWLRAVVAQRRVDGWRASARLTPLDEEAPPSIATTHTPDPAAAIDRPAHRQRFQRAWAETISSLEAGDRLRLGLYYRQQMTLAEIGRATGEHEATVSRRLDKIRRTIRQQVEDALRRAGLADADIRQCYVEAAEHGLQAMGVDSF